MWKPPERNMVGVQFEAIRKNIDAKYNAVHDELSDAYYNRKIFSNGGKTYNFAKLRDEDPVAAKELFDKLHGLIFLKRDVAFHRENKDKGFGIPEELYNIIDTKDGIIERRHETAAVIIEELRQQGIELEV